MNHERKLPEMQWYAVDFDGTLAEQVWPEPGIGDPIEDNVRKYKELASNGEDLIIYSARPWSDYAVLERWLFEQRIPYDALVLGKLLAKKYIDDKAIPAHYDSWF